MRRASFAIFFGAAGAAVCACSDLGQVQVRDPALQRLIAQKIAERRERPDDPKVAAELGELYRRANRVFEAAEVMLEAVQKNPKDAPTRAALAHVYISMGYVLRAVDQVRECLSIDRSHPDCLFALGSLFETDGSMQGLQQARSAFRQFLAVATPAHERFALVKSKLDQLDARLGPQAAEPPAHAAMPEPQTAEKNAEKSPHGDEPPAAAIPGHPKAPGEDDDVGELNEFGQALQRAFDAVKKNDAIAAEAAFREAARLRPNDPSALSGIAQSLLAQGKMEDAAKAAEDAFKADPNDSQSRWTLGLIMLRSGRDIEAGLDVWDALVRDDPEYAKQLRVPEQLQQIRAFIQQRNVHETPKP